MTQRSFLVYLATALLFAVPGQAQEGAAFRCTFKAVFIPLESSESIKSDFEKQIVSRRMDVVITRQPTATVTTDVFSRTRTMEASDYVVHERGDTGNDWALFRLFQGKARNPLNVLHINSRDQPIRFAFAWDSVIGLGTCEKVG